MIQAGREDWRVFDSIWRQGQGRRIRAWCKSCWVVIGGWQGQDKQGYGKRSGMEDRVEDGGTGKQEISEGGGRDGVETVVDQRGSIMLLR